MYWYVVVPSVVATPYHPKLRIHFHHNRSKGEFDGEKTATAVISGIHSSYLFWLPLPHHLANLCVSYNIAIAILFEMVSVVSILFCTCRLRVELVFLGIAYFGIASEILLGIITVWILQM